MTDEEKEKIRSQVEDLLGTKGAIIFNNRLEKIKKIPLRRIYSLNLDESPYVIAIDGTATPKVIEVCENMGCSNLIATNFVNTNTDINLISM